MITLSEWQGPPGPPGPSAYQQAVAAGYAGTEAQFTSALVAAASSPGGSPNLDGGGVTDPLPATTIDGGTP